ncbi:hypothetical protein HanIR_Chr08g0377471 [Helianthus annuus]|nr:hypothetical protein HanIR_Chr08g0377471 [Helianthus annuus]
MLRSEGRSTIQKNGFVGLPSLLSISSFSPSRVLTLDKATLEALFFDHLHDIVDRHNFAFQDLLVYITNV